MAKTTLAYDVARCTGFLVDSMHAPNDTIIKCEDRENCARFMCEGHADYQATMSASYDCKNFIKYTDE